MADYLGPIVTRDVLANAVSDARNDVDHLLLNPNKKATQKDRLVSVYAYRLLDLFRTTFIHHNALEVPWTEVYKALVNEHNQTMRILLKQMSAEDAGRVLAIMFRRIRSAAWQMAEGALA